MTKNKGTLPAICATIFIYNLMLGFGALSLPQAFSEAGIVTGIAILMTLGFLSFVTATFVIEAQAVANALAAPKPFSFAPPRRRTIVGSGCSCDPHHVANSTEQIVETMPLVEDDSTLTDNDAEEMNEASEVETIPAVDIGKDTQSGGFVCEQDLSFMGGRLLSNGAQAMVDAVHAVRSDGGYYAKVHSTDIEMDGSTDAEAASVCLVPGEDEVETARLVPGGSEAEHLKGPDLSADDCELFEIKVRVEMTQMAKLFRPGCFGFFFFVMMLYLLGDLAIYAAVVGSTLVPFFDPEGTDVEAWRHTIFAGFTCVVVPISCCQVGCPSHQLTLRCPLSPLCRPCTVYVLPPALQDEYASRRRPPVA